MTTTVTIAGATYSADSHEWDDDGRTRPNTWIETGTSVRDLITARVTQLIDEARAARHDEGLFVRDVVSTAMRVERAIQAHWTVGRIIETDAAIRTYQTDQPEQLADWVEHLLNRLPVIVYAEATDQR